MNNSKKLQTKKVKKKKLDSKNITRISKPAIIISALLFIVLAGAILFDQLYQPALMKIDGKKYTMSDLSFYFYNVESTYQSYDSMFGGGGAYWDMVYDEATGETFRDAAKQEAIQNARDSEILYNQAITDGYTLSDEEKTTVDTNATTLLSSSLTPAVIKKNHFTKAYLTKVLSHATLADRYRQDKINSLNIDDAAIKAGVNYEDYRQYDIQYLFISTKTTDADGKTVDMTADEKNAARDKINGVYESAKTTEDWSTLIPADETDLTYNSDDHFIKTDTTYPEDMKTTMMGMDNGAVSSLLEDPAKGYYIVRMVNNNSSESYDTAVKDAISKKENDEFTNLYNTDILPKHPYTIYDKALKGYTMGTITLAE